MKQAYVSFRKAYVPFCEGPFYMLLIGALILFGHLLAIEFWLNIVHILLLCLSLCLSDSIKPLAISNLTFVFQVTLVHSPSAPYFSTYYFEGAHLWIVITLVAVLVASLAYYLIRTGFFSHIRFGKTPLLLPLLVLSAVFLTNGLFSETYILENLLLGFVQVVVYLVDFLVLWDGLSRESVEDIMTFTVELSILVSWILVVELLNVYIVSIAPGWVDWLSKGEILFGWGVSNTCACLLSIQVPLLFYGIYRGTHVIPASLTVVAVLVAIVCTLSRSALLFTSIVLVVCLLYACCFSKHRKSFIFTSLGMIALVGVLCLIFRDRVRSILNYFSFVGFDDSGRFRVWRLSLEHALLNPVFGVGFYGETILGSLNTGQSYTTFYPEFRHNTLIEMLASCGIVGLVGYLYMRVCSLTIFFKRLSVEKIFLGLSIFTFLLECMLDIFTFSIYPVFFYNFALAAAFAIDDKQRDRLPAA